MRNYDTKAKFYNPFILFIVPHCAYFGDGRLLVYLAAFL